METLRGKNLKGKKRGSIIISSYHQSTGAGTIREAARIKCAGTLRYRVTRRQEVESDYALGSRC